VSDGASVLLTGVPARHLVEATAIVDAEGSVVLPAGAPGDLDRTAPGTVVLLVASGTGDAVPAATWRASYRGRIAYADGDPYPERVPPGWLIEHGDRVDTEGAAAPEAGAGVGDPGVEEDEDVEDEEDRGPQSFFEVSDLRPLRREDWVFTNELVPKQQRGGRTFLPAAPRLVRAPDSGPGD
jgi:hypothetical protein